MKKDKNFILIGLYAFLACGILFPLSILFLTFCISENNTLYLLGMIPTLILSVVLMMYSILLEKGYKLKYVLARKRFKLLVAKSLVKFNLKNVKFAKVFTKTRKPLFYSTGKLYYDENYFGEEYRDPKIKTKIILLYSTLLNNIKEGGGFYGFFDDLQTMDFDSTWQAYMYMCNESLSKELQYIISEVYMLTNFCLIQGGSSTEIESYNKTRAVIEYVFNPILANFETELERVSERLISDFKEEVKHGN